MAGLRTFPAGFETFVETGLGAGETLAHATHSGRFARCVSMETNLALVRRARTRYAILRTGLPVHRLTPSIRWRRGPFEPELYWGSSPRVLPQVCRPGQRTLFWLDAHRWPNRDTGRRDELRGLDPTWGDCPLLGELRAIFRVGWVAPPLVLVDDAPLFLLPSYVGTPWAIYRRDHCPTMDQITRALPPGWTVTVSSDDYELPILRIERRS